MDTDATENDPPLMYFGWWRQHKRERWVKFAESEYYGDTWNRLLDATSDRRNCEMLVTMNSDPNMDDRPSKRSA
jgi:hypothetical protein